MFRLHDGAPSAPDDKGAPAADLRAAAKALADRLKATHGTDDLEAALRAEGERALSESGADATPDPAVQQRLRAVAEKRRLILSGPMPEALTATDLTAYAAITLEGLRDVQRWATCIENLIAAGSLVQNPDGLLPRATVRNALPMLKAEGLEPGPGLVRWLALDVVPVTESVAKDPAEPGKQDLAVRRHRAIVAATGRLTQGGIDWREVSQASYARWLVANVTELAGVDSDTILRSYLKRKGLAPEGCVTGRQGAGDEDEAFKDLDRAWEAGDADGNAVQNAVKLRAIR